MNFTWPVSLTQAAGVTVVSSLWNQYGVIADIKHHLLETENCKSWSVIENDVILLLEEIAFPPALKLHLKNLVMLMGVELFKWISLTKPLLKFASHSPKSIIFVWSKRGIFDCDETTKSIIQSCSDKMLCFCLACTFSLEQTIHELWPFVCEHMTERDKNHLIKTTAILSFPLDFWVDYLNKGNEEFGYAKDDCVSYPIEFFYEYSFMQLCRIDPRCVSTINYLLNHTDPTGRRKFVLLALQYVLNVRPRDRILIISLLNKLSEDDVAQVIKENCYSIFNSFIIWPYTELFMPLMNLYSKHLSGIDYMKLLEDMFEFSSMLCGDNVYKHLTKQFWLSTPPAFKQYIIKKFISGSLLSRLFLFENTDDLMQLIFNNCNAEEKKQMIFHFETMNLCDLLVRKEQWCSLKLLLRNCIHSKIILEEFISSYKSYRPYYYNKDAQLRTIVLLEKVQEWFHDMK